MPRGGRLTSAPRVFVFPFQPRDTDREKAGALLSTDCIAGIMPVSMTTKKNSHSGSKTASQNSSRDGSSHGGMLLFKEFNKSPSKEETSPKSTTSAVEDLERQVAEMHKFINSNGLATALEAHMGALPPKESPTSTLDGAVDLTPATDTALAGKWCYRSSSRHSLTAAASPVPARREMGCSLPASYSFTAPFDGIDKTDVRPQFPTFAKKLDELYPGAMPYDEAVVAISALLRQHGFTETNSIALISACRDESMKSFTTALDLLWGETFNISSLAGILTCGKTGFGAAMHHSPVDENGLERYVVFTGPHSAPLPSSSACRRPFPVACSHLDGALVAPLCSRDLGRRRGGKDGARRA